MQMKDIHHGHSKLIPIINTLKVDMGIKVNLYDRIQFVKLTNFLVILESSNLYAVIDNATLFISDNIACMIGNDGDTSCIAMSSKGEILFLCPVNEERTVDVNVFMTSFSFETDRFIFYEEHLGYLGIEVNGVIFIYKISVEESMLHHLHSMNLGEQMTILRPTNIHIDQYRDARNKYSSVRNISFWWNQGFLHMFCCGAANWLMIYNCDDESNFKLISCNEVHTGWITCFSKSLRARAFVSGDSLGTLVIWGDSGGVPTAKRTILFACSAPITCISVIDIKKNSSVYVGDERGSIYCYEVDTSTYSVSLIRRLLLSSTSIPHQITAHIDSSKCHAIEYTCELTANVISVQFHPSSSFVFRCFPDYPPSKGAHNMISAVALAQEFSLLVTCGFDCNLFIWSLSNGRLITQIKMKYNNCRSLSLICCQCLDHSFDDHDGVEIKLLCGFANGSLCFHEVKMKSLIESQSFALNDDIKDSISIPVFDILEDSKDNISSKSSEPFASLLNLPIGEFDDITIQSSASLQPTFRLIGQELQIDIPPKYIPVTHIFVSYDQNHCAVAHGTRYLAIYSCRSFDLLRVIEFERCFTHISRLIFTDQSRQRSSDFCLLVQEGKKCKIIECVSKKKLIELELSFQESDLACSLAWEISNVSSNEGDTEASKSLVGICVTKTLGVYFFGEKIGFQKINLPDCPPEYDSPLNSLVIGCEGFDIECSPLAVIWTMRRLFILRVSLGLDEASGPKIMRTIDYLLPSSRVHIVYAKSLLINFEKRYHHILVVLSDGSSSIIQL